MPRWRIAMEYTIPFRGYLVVAMACIIAAWVILTLAP
jgi:hypothetical protein